MYNNITMSRFLSHGSKVLEIEADILRPSLRKYSLKWLRPPFGFQIKFLKIIIPVSFFNLEILEVK